MIKTHSVTGQGVFFLESIKSTYQSELEKYNSLKKEI